MSLQAWIVVAIVVGSLVLLARGRQSPELVMIGGLVALLLTGILTPAQALAGFANEGMITVAAMYVVAAGLRETGGIELVVRYLYGRANHVRHAQLKVMLPTIFMSAFLNNTPVVATFIPAITAWARRNGISASKLLIPLSYAAIFGGTCTLIGTSTNLVVNGLWVAEGGAGLRMFDLAWVGIPVAVTGIAYVMLVGSRLLPDNKAAKGLFDNPREYTVEMIVDRNGPLVNQTIQQAGLRHLGVLYLVEIDREGRVIPAVNSEERLRPNDRLVFAGDVNAIVDLQRLRGLLPALSEDRTLEKQVPERKLVEVVVSPRCPLINKTLRDSRFHTYYGATVIAVGREGKRITGGLGDLTLRAADTLLLEARPVWVERNRHSPDFLLVSSVEDPRRHCGHGQLWPAGPGDGGITGRRPDVPQRLHQRRQRTQERGHAGAHRDRLLLRPGQGPAGDRRGRDHRRAIDDPARQSPLAGFAHGLPDHVHAHRGHHQQCGGGGDVPHRRGDGGIAGRQPHPFHHCHHDGGIVQLRHATGLPDQPDGDGTRRLQVRRLPAHRRATQPAAGGGYGFHHPAGVALLGAGARAVSCQPDSQASTAFLRAVPQR
jgi:di/tricarboxylate transporter